MIVAVTFSSQKFKWNGENGQTFSPPLADGEVHKPSAFREYVSTNH